jgi:hypothetical protein
MQIELEFQPSIDFQSYSEYLHILPRYYPGRGKSKLLFPVRIRANDLVLIHCMGRGFSRCPNHCSNRSHVAQATSPGRS